MKPRLFIGSSQESLSIAYACQQNLQREAEVTVWTQGVFTLSANTLDSLISEVNNSDFAMFLFSPDDLVKIRGQENSAARDNVVLELGLFVGNLGKERCFVLIPDDADDLHIPTDLLGITLANYETGRADGNWQAATGPACTSVRQSVHAVGLRSITPDSSDASPRQERTESERDTLDEQFSESDSVPEAETAAEAPGWFAESFEGNNEKALELLSAQIDSASGETRLRFLETWRAGISYRINSAEGERLFEEIFSKYPDNSSPYRLMVRELLRKNQFTKALEYIDRGYEGIDDKIELNLLKSRCLIAGGRDEEALELLLDSSIQNPERSDISRALSTYYTDRKIFGEAKRWFQRLVEQEPDDEEFLWDYTDLLYDNFDRKLALVPINRLNDIQPNNPDYVTFRASVYFLLGLNDLALREYKRGIELSSVPEPEALANIGNLLTSRGLYTEAIDYLHKALKLNPESDYSHRRLASSIKSRDKELERLKEIEIEVKREITRDESSDPEDTRDKGGNSELDAIENHLEE